MRQLNTKQFDTRGASSYPAYIVSSQLRPLWCQKDEKMTYSEFVEEVQSEMEKSTYLQMRAEMWKIGELEYACICVMEGMGFDYYDYEKSTPKRLIDDAEYVLATYYEYGHVRNEALKEGNLEEKQECKDEIKQIRKFLRKWKPKAKGGK